MLQSMVYAASSPICKRPLCHPVGIAIGKYMLQDEQAGVRLPSAEEAQRQFDEVVAIPSDKIRLSLAAHVPHLPRIPAPSILFTWTIRT